MLFSLRKPIKKIYQKIIIIIFQHVKAVISSRQHEFFPKRSTAANLLQFFHFFSKDFSADSAAHCIHTGLAKVFDRVCHNFQPLTSLAFSHIFCSRWHLYPLFLEYSAWSGFSRGSVFGLLLFLIVINDTSRALQRLQSLLFAKVVIICRQIYSLQSYILILY